MSRDSSVRVTEAVTFFEDTAKNITTEGDLQEALSEAFPKDGVPKALVRWWYYKKMKEEADRWNQR